VPQSAQNLAPGWSNTPHSVQCLSNLTGSPQLGQNFALVFNGVSHFGQEAWIVSRQFDSDSFLSSSDILACAHTSSTERLACAADISTPISGAHSLHKPRLVFQHFSRQTQLWQRGHWTNSGNISLLALAKASSWAFSQAAECALPVRLAAELKIPPNKLLAVSITLLMVPVTEGVNLLR